MTSPSENDIIEHIVLFNVKEEDEEYPTKVNEMVNALNNLNSLDTVIYLTAGPILRTKVKSKASDDLKLDKFTHMLHARYRTVSDLHDYSVHPDHVFVVENFVRPLCADVMSVDWSAKLGDENLILVPRPGSAMRVTFLQVKDENREEEFFERIKEIKENMGPFEQVSYGKNFSDRGKGYNVATLVIFPDLNELDSSEEYEDQMKSLVKTFRGESFTVDYIIPRLVALNVTTE